MNARDAAELCDSSLRVELVQDPLNMENGLIELPEKPGLGIELNWDAVEKYQVDRSSETR